MAEGSEHKCGHTTCDCVIDEGRKYCSEYCENADKAGVMEIGCGCEHTPCR